MKFTAMMTFLLSAALFLKNIEVVRKIIPHFERDYRNQKRIKWGICYKANLTKLLGILEVFDVKKKANTVYAIFSMNVSGSKNYHLFL